MYFWIERIRTLPRSRPYNEEEEDEFVRQVEAKRQQKLILTEADSRKFSLEELSDLDNKGVVT